MTITAAGRQKLTYDRRILAYLIPCKLLTSHVLPTKKLLEQFPRLQELFLPLSQCIRRGDLRGFDIALQKGEDEFVKRRIYLTLERGRDITLRNLLRKVFLAGGFEEQKDADATPVRRTRVPVAEFRAAICMESGGEEIGTDEVECLMANMIYKVSATLPNVLIPRIKHGQTLNTSHCTQSFTPSILCGPLATSRCLPRLRASRLPEPGVHYPTQDEATCKQEYESLKWMSFTGSYERVHRTGARHRRAFQEGCLPRNRSLRELPMRLRLSHET